jgi:plasmid stability protein
MRHVIASRIMPRTTLDLDPTVLRELRRRSAAEGRSMGRLASELLMRSLSGEEAAKVRSFEWRTADLGEPRVDLEDKEAVRAILDAG